jgi:hypothetical protein
MDVIKRMAKEFSYDLQSFGYTLEKFDSELSSKLIYITKNSEKLRFLSYLRDIAETKYKEHAPKCTNPKNCGTNQSLENALYAINQQYDEYFEIEGGVNLNEKPAMSFFTEGQYFDAFSAIKELIKKAENSIVLIDGYVSADTLAFFPGKEPKIKLRILTGKKSINTEFQRAVDLYNKQYENLQTETTKNFHDRFLILDDKTFYHIGASIKDAGNKTFMYTQIEDENIMDTIRKKINKEWDEIYK